jgi:hypothetical protein
MINARAVDKIERHVRDDPRTRRQVAGGGKRLRNNIANGPNYYAPTVLGDAKGDMVLSCEETFGPVVPLFRFRDEADVVRQANDTPFGLAAYFYARDLKRIWRVADQLETGIVGINEGLIGSEAAALRRRQGIRLWSRRVTLWPGRLHAHQVSVLRKSSERHIVCIDTCRRARRFRCAPATQTI